VRVFIPVVPKINPRQRFPHGILVNVHILEGDVPAHAILAAGENSMVVIPGGWLHQRFDGDGTGFRIARDARGCEQNGGEYPP
jgi:hypothetical protein